MSTLGFVRGGGMAGRRRRAEEAPAPDSENSNTTTNNNNPEVGAAEAEDQTQPEVEFEVEKVLDCRRNLSTQRFYLIQWKDYPVEQASWEPEENVAHANEAVDEYWASGPTRLRRGKVFVLFR